MTDKWEMERPEDRKRWWVREQLYTIVPRTPLSDSVYTKEWDEAVLCIGEELKFPDSRGFNARTVNGWTYLSPMPITDGDVIHARVPLFLAKIDELSRNLDQNLERCHAEQEREQAYWRTANLADPNLMTLLEYWRRVLVTSDRFWKLHFLIVFPRHVLAGMFEHAAHDLAGLQKSSDIGKLTQSHGMTRQLELDMSLWGLAERAIDLGFKDLFVNTDETELRAKLEATAPGRGWSGELEQFLDRFGARSSLPIELYGKSWKEDPTPVLGTIRSYVAQGGKYNFDRLSKDMADERERLVAQTLAGIKDAEKREQFRKTLEPARKFQQAMEDDNFYFLWSIMQVRKVAVEIGKRLAAAKALDDAADVFFLRREQMEQALTDVAAGLYDVIPYAAIARTARAEWERYSRTTPPPYIGNLPDEISDIMLTQFWGILGRKQLDSQEGKVSGLGASAGTVEGIARHVVSAAEFGRIKAGEILICRSTNPAWTPLFSKVAAVVTDQGGTLSHAAVVAREYQIPAVLGTIHGTRRIPDGARVRVDGAAGTVEVLTR